MENVYAYYIEDLLLIDNWCKNCLCGLVLSFFMDFTKNSIVIGRDSPQKVHEFAALLKANISIN